MNTQANEPVSCWKPRDLQPLVVCALIGAATHDLWLMNDSHYGLQCFPKFKTKARQRGLRKALRRDREIATDWLSIGCWIWDILLNSCTCHRDTGRSSTVSWEASFKIKQARPKFRKIRWSLSHKGNGNSLGIHSLFMEGLLAPWTWPPLVPHRVIKVSIGFHIIYIYICINYIYDDDYYYLYLYLYDIYIYFQHVLYIILHSMSFSLFAIATFSSYLQLDLWLHPISLWGFSTWDVQVARQDLIVPSRRKLKQAQHEGCCWRLNSGLLRYTV